MKLIAILFLCLMSIVGCKATGGRTSASANLESAGDDPTWAAVRCWNDNRDQYVWFQRFSTSAQKSTLDSSRYKMNVLYKKQNNKRELDGAAINYGSRRPYQWDILAEENVGGGGMVPNMKIKYKFILKNKELINPAPEMEMYLSDQNGELKMTNTVFFCKVID